MLGLVEGSNLAAPGIVDYVNVAISPSLAGLILMAGAELDEFHNFIRFVKDYEVVVFDEIELLCIPSTFFHNLGNNNHNIIQEYQYYHQSKDSIITDLNRIHFILNFLDNFLHVSLTRKLRPIQANVQMGIL